jgi:hypothetical protein
VRLRLPDPPVTRLVAAAVRAADLDRRIPFPLVNLAHLDRDSWQTHYHCYAGWEQRTTRLCPVGDRHAARTVVLYGDSHAGMWLPALDLLGRRDGFRVLPLIKLGCAPFDVPQLHGGAPLPACPPFRVWALHQMARIRPADVVLAYRGLLEVVAPAGESEATAWRSGAERSLKALRALTPRVSVISDVSYFDTSPGDCLTGVRARMSTCTQTEQPVTVEGNDLTRAAARASGARFVDVTGLVCSRHRCPLVVDHVVTYRDPWHISRTWGRVVAAELGRRLRIGARPERG